MKKALIIGVSGQDGAYLAKLLLEKGYEVHGIVRRSSSFNTARIDHIYQDPHQAGSRLKLHYGDLNDANNLSNIIRMVEPNEVYNLAAISFVAMSVQQPELTANITGLGVLRMLEAIRIVGGTQQARRMKIVVDCGNGIPGASAPGILRALGCEVIDLYSKVDGDFPNHHPDPSKPENLQDLINALKTSGAELGLAFDGDGDRLGIVTKDGNNIYPDRQIQLFAQDVLSRVPGGTVLFDVKCSQRLAPAIEAAGGKPLMYKTGHSLIKAQMRAIEAAGGQAPLGGEMSGHIFFKERWYGFDDGTYAGCRLLEIVSRAPDANAVLNALPTSFSTPELNVACAEGEPHSVTSALQVLAGDAFKAPAKVFTIDGLRVDWPDGFGLIRASNTTPVLALRFEGQTEAALHRIQAEMLALLRSVKPDAQIQAAAH